MRGASASPRVRLFLELEQTNNQGLFPIVSNPNQSLRRTTVIRFYCSATHNNPLITILMVRSKQARPLGRARPIARGGPTLETQAARLPQLPPRRKRRMRPGTLPNN
jgi:hypothetical protein